MKAFIIVLLSTVALATPVLANSSYGCLAKMNGGNDRRVYAEPSMAQAKKDVMDDCNAMGKGCHIVACSDKVPNTAAGHKVWPLEKGMHWVK